MPSSRSSPPESQCPSSSVAESPRAATRHSAAARVDAPAPPDAPTMVITFPRAPTTAGCTARVPIARSRSAASAGRTKTRSAESTSSPPTRKTFAAWGGERSGARVSSISTANALGAWRASSAASAVSMTWRPVAAARCTASEWVARSATATTIGPVCGCVRVMPIVFFTSANVATTLWTTRNLSDTSTKSLWTIRPKCSLLSQRAYTAPPAKWG